MGVVNKSAAPSSLLFSAMEFFVPEASARFVSVLDLEAKAPPRWRDTAFLWVFAVFFYVMRSTLDRFLFDPFARKCLFGSSAVFDTRKSTKQKSTSITSSSSHSSPGAEVEKLDDDDKQSGSRNSIRRRKKATPKAEVDANCSSESPPPSDAKKESGPRPNGRHAVSSSSSLSASSLSSLSASTKKTTSLANGHVDATLSPPTSPKPRSLYGQLSSDAPRFTTTPTTTKKKKNNKKKVVSSSMVATTVDITEKTTKAGAEKKTQNGTVFVEKTTKTGVGLAATKSETGGEKTSNLDGDKRRETEKTGAKTEKKMTEEEKRVLKKFKESAWKAIYYTSAEIFFFSVSYNEPWFGNTISFWENWPQQDVKLKLKALYMYAGGFCFYSCVSLYMWESRRSDFFVTVCHHAVTILLILFSYVNSFARAGSIVLAIHDMNDIFLEIAKMFVYTKVELGSTIFFSLFVVFWVVLRLIYFPFWIIYSTSYEVLQIVNVSAHPEAPYLYYFFNTLLITLLVLNLYWWALIVRMLVRMLKNKGEVGEDVREESD